MANNPKKLTDPTDEALTAIEQVLSVPDEPLDTRPVSVVESAPTPQEAPRPTPRVAAPAAR